MWLAKGQLAHPQSLQLESYCLLFSPFQVKRELAGVLIFESHAKGGTVCKCSLPGNTVLAVTPVNMCHPSLMVNAPRPLGL